jgi:ubiquinone/menaquinone biosynthesis C-methylase UbiE
MSVQQSRQTSLSPAEAGQVTPQRIVEMAWGFGPPMVIAAAVRTQIFDVLEAGPKTIQETAAATGASPRGLRAVMDALVGIGLLKRQAEQYALTPESAAFLVSSKPSYYGGFVAHLAGQILPNWLELSEIIKTGQPSTNLENEAGGADFFSKFVEDLLVVNYPAARALADAMAGPLGAGGAAKVLDIAAGAGVWGIALAEKVPNVQVTAVDWAPVTEVAKRVAKRHNVGERYRTVTGDILEADFGSGYRVATLGHILHSEGEPRSRRLLRKVRDALAPGGTIAIAEFTPNDDRTGGTIPLLFGVNMLVHTKEGDVFTFKQLAGWLTDAGFVNVRQLEVPGPSPLILAEKR